MKKSNELVNILESSTHEKQFPFEYEKEARALIDERKKAEKELRDSLPKSNGKDDRLCHKLYELDIKLRRDITELRKKYNLD